MVDNSERIDKFLKKQMTSEENASFLNELRYDDELRKEAQFTALLIQELQERQAKEDAEIIEDVLKSKNKAKIIRMSRWMLSVAAMFILIIGAVSLWHQQVEKDNTFEQTDALYAKYYSPWNATSPRSVDDKTIKAELAKLYKRINADKDITPVISRLQTIYDNIASNNESYDKYRDYKNDIAWYLALAYLRDHNVEKTKEMLKPLVDYGDEEAIRLMAEIEKMQL